MTVLCRPAPSARALRFSHMAHGLAAVGLAFRVYASFRAVKKDVRLTNCCMNLRVTVSLPVFLLSVGVRKNPFCLTYFCCRRTTASIRSFPWALLSLKVCASAPFGTRRLLRRLGFHDIFYGDFSSQLVA